MPTAVHPFANDVPGASGKRRDQDGCPMSFAVISHRAGADLRQRRSRLRAIARSHLALLVDRQHQRGVRRVEVESDNVLNCLAKFGVTREVRNIRGMRLQAIRGPNALHARTAKSNFLGDLVQRQTRAARQLFVQGQVNDPLDRRNRKRRVAAARPNLPAKPDPEETAGCAFSFPYQNSFVLLCYVTLLGSRNFPI